MDITSKPDKKKPVFLRQILDIGAGTLINMVLSLISTPIITRIVDPAEYGQLTMFNTYTNIALLVLCLGLDQALVRFFHDQEENLLYQRGLLRLCIKWPILISTAGALLLSVIAFCFPTLFEFPFLVMVLLGINVIVNIWNRFVLLVLRVESKSGAYALCNVLHRLVYIIAALSLIFGFNKHFLLLLVIATVLSMLIPSLIGTGISKSLWFFKKAEKISNKKEIFQYSLPFILSMGVVTLFQSCSTLFLNHFCDYNEVGIYSGAFSLVAIFAIIQTSFNALWAPMQIEHLVKHPDDKSFYEKANCYITIVMFFFGFCLVLCKDVFALLLGEKYREAAALLPFLIFNPIMYTVSETTLIGIEYSKKSYLNIFVGLASLATNIIGCLFLIPSLGGKGAAISTGVAYIVFFIMRTLLSNRYYPVNYHLGKFALMTAVSLGYATVATFLNGFLWNVASFLLCLLTLFILYRTDIKGLVKLGIKQFKEIVTR